MHEFLNKDVSYTNLNKYQKHKVDWIEETEKKLNTKKRYYGQFESNVNRIEMIKERDLYEFTVDEIISIIRDKKWKKPRYRDAFSSVVRNYITWACKKGYRVNGNPFDEIDTAMLSNSSKMVESDNYQPLDKFFEFISTLKKCSDVDKALLTLLRYGVKTSYVGSVKWEDVDKESKVLNVKTDGGFTKLPIDNDFIDIIHRAQNCESIVTDIKEYKYNDCATRCNMKSIA